MSEHTPDQPIISADRHDEVAQPPSRYANRRFKWFLGVAMLAIAIVLFLPLLLPPRQHGQTPETRCVSNQKHLALIALTFADDHEGHIPTPEQLGQALEKNSRLLECPDAPDLANGYALNEALTGIVCTEIESPEAVLVSFDALNGKPDFRHRNEILIASFLDGHIQRLSREKWKAIWAQRTPRLREP